MDTILVIVNAPVEAWKSNNTKVGIVKTSGAIKDKPVDVSMESWKVLSNPIKDGKIKFSFAAITSKCVSTQIIDNNGKILLQKQQYIAKGNSSSEINFEAANGIYYLNINGLNCNSSKPILMLK